MYGILEKEKLAPNVIHLKIEAPAVARKAQPGQFVILRVDEKGERIPISLAGWDRDQGTIDLIFLVVGTSTRKLSLLNPGASVLNAAGPFGRPTEIKHYGEVVCAAGCFGVGAMLPVAAALQAEGNRVVAVMEARARALLFWEDRLRAVSDELVVATGDGSLGRKGWANDVIADLINAGRKIDRVIAVGCTFMMMECSKATRPHGIPTVVSLTPIMVDGTGMCGCCRVQVGGQTCFACVDGPEFDGHQVDWELVISRQKSYLDEEGRSLNLWERANWHKLMAR